MYSVKACLTLTVDHRKRLFSETFPGIPHAAFTGTTHA
jgi:hypothetical protein